LCFINDQLFWTHGHIHRTAVPVAFRLQFLCIIMNLEVQEQYLPTIRGAGTPLPCVPTHFNHWTEKNAKYNGIQVGHVREFPRGMHGISAARPLAIIHLSCVALGANEPDTIDTEHINIYIPCLPVKQLARHCCRPLPKVEIARWQTARVTISLFPTDQSRRSSFTVIGYSETGRRRSPMTCRLLPAT